MSTVDQDANALDGPAIVAPVQDDSPLKIGDGFGDHSTGFAACSDACKNFPGSSPFYGINPAPSRSQTPASPRNWQWSIAPPNPKPAIDWAQFAHGPTDGEFMRNLQEARKLLALRIDRGAPPEMIQWARNGLDAIEQKIHAAIAARQASQKESENPPQTIFGAMSPGVRALALGAMLVHGAVIMAQLANRPRLSPEAQREAIIVQALAAERPPGPGYQYLSPSSAPLTPVTFPSIYEGWTEQKYNSRGLPTGRTVYHKAPK